jgi:Holliday junction resolvase RusA-like endonuclease
VSTLGKPLSVPLAALSDVSGVRVWVAGRPRTKGSLKPVHIKLGAGRCKVSLTESGEYAVAWKNAMIAGIRAACVCARWPGPVRVDTTFIFEKLCKPDFDAQLWPWPTREKGEFAHGDEDKLRRNALDALTQSGLILDDSQVVGKLNMKRWAVMDERAGVWIEVSSA